VTTDVFDDTPEGAPPFPRTQASLQSEAMRKLLTSNEYRALRKQFRFDEEHRWVGKRQGAPCWLCGGDIDYRLSYPHPYSWSLDHALTVKERPDLALDRNNFRSSHLDCNRQRGTDDPKLDIGNPSEIW
jgi:hypothetical protein